MSVMTKSIIVKVPADRAFGLWADFENFPQFMHDLKVVHKTGAETSHWTMKGPFGKELEWNARITDLQPNKRIAWHSTDGDIKTSGSVTFDALDTDRTQITVMLQYVLPAGKLGEAGAHILDNPEKHLEEDLRRFKAHAETTVRI